MSHLLSNRIRVIQSNIVNLKSRVTRDTSLQIRVHIYVSHREHVMGTQKNRSNETVLLCIQNICL